ncbi:MAG: hypothetical protein M1837_001540 [Sclerophora amabilis]|nr:MAG: hypothetical protein M1837_001540 [Sclerophora amabilis]
MGRPWPLSSLTIQYTDIYLWRNFNLMQQSLNPDTIFFLGDLFDGGREWTGGGRGTSSEDQWKDYGDAFWLREFDRFGRIFFDLWMNGGDQAAVGQRGRKIIASLPGNHDLGLGVGIQLSVRDRFGAFFGEGNRVDVIANHTFVSVDTVSLSAMGQDDSSSASKASENTEDDAASRSGKVWKPVQEFLDDVRQTKRRAVDRELRIQRGLTETPLQPHEIVNLNPSDLPDISSPETRNATDLPTILLTHVPLYRSAGTPCGPLREHWPPSPPLKGETQSPEKDDRNAIAVRAGYQYQNVLTPDISKDLIEKVGNVAHVFSGDDHDYCEVSHKGYTASSQASASSIVGGIKEITVKSISWAMGVRKPGFVMLSLWNPVDEDGRPMSSSTAARQQSEGAAGEFTPTSSTIQSHLCLLPDQLGIFIRYAVGLVLTLLVLAVRAFLKSREQRHPSHSPEGSRAVPAHFPNYREPPSSSAEYEKSTESDLKVPEAYAQSSSSSDSSKVSASSNMSYARGLAARTPATRPRSASPANGSYAIPLIDHVQNSSDAAKSQRQRGTSFDIELGSRDSHSSAFPYTSSKTYGGKTLSGPIALTFMMEFTSSFVRLAFVVLPWYVWLLRRG